MFDGGWLRGAHERNFPVLAGQDGSVPRDVLAACFGVAESAFDQVPREVRPVVITRHK